jgi:murein DD-endopeptidase MepM/ murein hydrolase activator NlpD
MSKVKYYYDPETLAYRKIEPSKGRVFKYVLLFLTSSVIFGFLLVFISFQFFIEFPREKAMKRELQNMQLQYEVLDKQMQQVQEVLSNIENRDNNLYRTYFETNPIPEEQRLAGFGGVNRYKSLEGYEHSKIIIEASKKMDVLQKRLVVQSKSLDEITKLASEKEKLLSAVPAIQPVRNEDLTRVASGYGYRIDPFLKSRKFHYGMDFSAVRGTPIYASGDGVVVRADSRSSGYGKHVRIDHGFGYVSLYAHMSKYNVRKGQKVKRGDIIGFVGNTGRSVAPHLHYEVFKDGDRINPMNFYYGSLTAEEFAEMLQNSEQSSQSLD